MRLGERRSMRGTLRMPNAIDDGVEAACRGTAAPRHWPRRTSPLVEPASLGALAADPSISALMSATVARVPAPPARSAERMSPVPPATSSSAKSRSPSRRVDRGDQRVLPGAMQPARHQVVHQVVAPCHRVEDVVDQRLLVVERHLAEAEMGVGRAWADHSARWRGCHCWQARCRAVMLTHHAKRPAVRLGLPRARGSCGAGTGLHAQ